MLLVTLSCAGVVYTFWLLGHNVQSHAWICKERNVFSLLQINDNLYFTTSGSTIK